MAGKRSKAAAFKQKDAAAGSCEAVGGGAEEEEEAEVAKDLELLADFGADVKIFGMEFCEGASMGVDVG
jgi:hypothetical protein